jgi:putative spermidine/putrescine transport system permease protein
MTMSGMTDATLAQSNSSLEAQARRRMRIRFFVQIAPVLVLYVVFLLLPYLNLFGLSFQRYDWMHLVVREFTLENYGRLAEDSFYLRIVAQTILLSLGVTTITLVIGYPTAWKISQASAGMRSLLLAAVLSPLLVNLVVRTYSWQVLLNDFGIINSWLLNAGLIDSPVRLGRNMFAVVVGLTQITLPFMILSLLSVIDGLRKDVLEVADSLGSSPMRKFTEIILPLTLPGIAAGSVLVFCYCNAAFVTPQLLGGGQVSTLATTIFNQFSVALNFPFGATLVIVLLLITIPFVVLQHFVLPSYATKGGGK